MQEKIKEILGVFLKMPENQINTDTVIDRTALGSSILLHRMYAKLAAENLVVKDYQEVRTLGDFLQKLDREKNGTDGPKTGKIISLPPNEPVVSPLPVTTKESAGIGIDIELVSAMPETGDFREDAFYTMNFSVAEISYCILQPRPYASFAGLFAAKEAIVKANNTYKKLEFKDIIIQHLPNGKPFHTGFNISVSHTDETAVAIAIPAIPQHSFSNEKEMVARLPVKATGNTFVVLWLLVLTSLLLSVIVLFLMAGKKG